MIWNFEKETERRVMKFFVVPLFAGMAGSEREKAERSKIFR